MKKSRKEFIIAAHKEACQTWKQKIEKEFPKLFKKENQELNKWFKNERLPKWLMFYTDKKSVYGFNYLGDWHERESEFVKNPYDDKDNRLATEQEVKEALIKESEKRGFKKGITFINLFNGRKHVAKSNELRYLNSCELVLDNNTIFNLSGKWAEIIQNTISRSEAEKQLNAKIID